MTFSVENKGRQHVQFFMPPGTPMVSQGSTGLTLVLVDAVDLDLKPGASGKATVFAIPAEDKGAASTVGSRYEPSRDRNAFQGATKAAVVSFSRKDKMQFRIPGQGDAGRMLTTRWAMAELQQGSRGLSPDMRKKAEAEVAEAYSASGHAGQATAALSAFWRDVEATADPTGKSRIDTQTSQERIIFDNTNIQGVLGGGEPAGFTLDRPTFITAIRTYHWNKGRGQPEATWIRIRGTQGGQFKAHAETPPTWWKVAPMMLLQPGKYLIEDGDPGSWARNPDSGGKGFVQISGRPAER